MCFPTCVSFSGFSLPTRHTMGPGTAQAASGCSRSNPRGESPDAGRRPCSGPQLLLQPGGDPSKPRWLPPYRARLIPGALPLLPGSAWAGELSSLAPPAGWRVSCCWLTGRVQVHVHVGTSSVAGAGGLHSQTPAGAGTGTQPRAGINHCSILSPAGPSSPSSVLLPVRNTRRFA